jgi:branched-chain amino acid transport system ATP-binding protein
LDKKKMLELSDVCAGYGPIRVIDRLSLSVATGKCVCIIGPNGAGKTTALSAICGLVRISSGSVNLDSRDVTRHSTDSIVRAGLSLVPEGRRIVANMTVEDNLLVGAYTRKKKCINAGLDGVYQRFELLRQRRKRFAGSLSGGEQQMLAIGRALMANPRVLLLDEPSMGLAPQVVADIFRIIREINREGTTILLVEQNARKALSIADYGYVLEGGRIQMEGTASDLVKSPKVLDAYLGSAGSYQKVS